MAQRRQRGLGAQVGAEAPDDPVRVAELGARVGPRLDGQRAGDPAQHGIHQTPGPLGRNVDGGGHGRIRRRAHERQLVRTEA